MILIGLECTLKNIIQGGQKFGLIVLGWGLGKYKYVFGIVSQNIEAYIFGREKSKAFR